MMYEVRTEPLRPRIDEQASHAEMTAAAGVYPLLACPPLPPGNFVLARRERGSSPSLLAMGRIHGTCVTQNLARIRQLGAELGATEVHIYPA